LGPSDELIDALDLPPKTVKAHPQSDLPDQSFRGITTLDVDSLHADVTVNPSVDDQTHVAFKSDGKLVDKLAYSTQVEQNGQTLHVSIKPIKRFFLSSASELTIELMVPATLQLLRMESASGDLHLADVALDQITVRSASGDVDLHRVKATRVEATTASGDVHLEASSGILAINTANGSVDATDHQAQEVTLRSASGDLNYEGRCPNLSINTASGDGRLDITHAQDITIHTVNGDFDIVVDRADEGLNATMKSVSGDLVVHSPEGTFQADRHNDAITLKNGTVRINLKSVNADFKIRQHA
jgi:hypothetical protein